MHLEYIRGTKSNDGHQIPLLQLRHCHHQEISWADLILSRSMLGDLGKELTSLAVQEAGKAATWGVNGLNSWESSFRSGNPTGLLLKVFVISEVIPLYLSGWPLTSSLSPLNLKVLTCHLQTMTNSCRVGLGMKGRWAKEKHLPWCQP